MDSFADNNALTRYVDKIKSQLSTKAKDGHKHYAVNGYTIVISDTVPTENDEKVITLIVDVEHVPEVPSVDITFQETHVSAEKHIFRDLIYSNFLYRTLKYTKVSFKAFADGEPVDAEFQVESESWDGTRRIVRDYSPDDWYEWLSKNNSRFVKVRVDGHVEEFSLSIQSWITDEEIALLIDPDLESAGLFVDGNRWTNRSDKYYPEILENAVIEYKFPFNDGITASDVASADLYVFNNDEFGTLNVSPYDYIQEQFKLGPLSISSNGLSRTMAFDELNFEEDSYYQVVSKVVYKNGYTIWNAHQFGVGKNPADT